MLVLLVSVNMIYILHVSAVFELSFMNICHPASGYFNNLQATKLTVDGYILEILDMLMRKDSYMLLIILKN